MITIKDIAAAAGVSKSTVSRVLTGSGYVNESTKERIKKVIEETGYQPSASARNLSTNSTRTIGVVVPEIGNTFYTEVLEGISEITDEQDLTIIYCNTGNDPAKEAKALETLLGHRVLGMIVAPSVDYSDPERRKKLRLLLRQLGAPAVMLDRTVEGLDLDSVVYDNFGAGYAAAEALIQAGNETVGILTGDMNLALARDRYKGYEKAMKKYKKPIRKEFVYRGDFSLDTAYRISCDMLDSGSIPDAIVTSNNETTLGLLRAVRERGLHFGTDIAMVGIDHIDVLDIIDYNYSYVTRDTREMGRRAIRTLLERIRHPQMPVQCAVMPFRLVLKGAEKKEVSKDDL